MADFEDDFPNFSSAFTYAAIPSPIAVPRLTSPPPAPLQQQTFFSPRFRARPVSMSAAGLRQPFTHQRNASHEPSLSIQFRHYRDQAPPKPKPRFVLQATACGTIARRRARTLEDGGKSDESDC